jgi:phosphatidylglycerophosphate synthase
MKQVAGAENVHAWIVNTPSHPGHAAVRPIEIWGLSPLERLRRSLRVAGVPDGHIQVGATAAATAQDVRVILLRADYVFDERLISALIEQKPTRDVVLVDPDNQTAVGAVTTRDQLDAVLPVILDAAEIPAGQCNNSNNIDYFEPAALVSAYSSALRKFDPPYLLPIRSEQLAQIENRIFGAAYKGITDVVTKWVWPLPARAVTRLLARFHVRPNMVTGLSWVLVGAATWLFVEGHFGLGLLCAWLMTFLDTVDGKLARVTFTSSRIGHVLDHGLDLVHPPFWYLAWVAGLSGSVSINVIWADPTTSIIIGGYIIGRLLEGLFMLAFHMEIHSWRPVDSFFRTITARRNPNLILLTLGTFASRPDLGFWLVALWTVCSLMFHTMRFGQAFVQRWHGQPIQTWQVSRTPA